MCKSLTKTSWQFLLPVCEVLAAALLASLLSASRTPIPPLRTHARRLAYSPSVAWLCPGSDVARFINVVQDLLRLQLRIISDLVPTTVRIPCDGHMTRTPVACIGYAPHFAFDLPLTYSNTRTQHVLKPT